MRLIGILAAAALACTLAGCAAPQQQPDHSQLKVNDAGVSSDGGAQSGEGAEGGVSSAEEAKPTASELRAKLDITEVYRSDFNHGGGDIGWRNSGETRNVTAELVRRGFSDQDIAPYSGW